MVAKRAELAWLQADHANREEQLATQKMELAEFEKLYLLRLGSLNAELKEWKVRLANLPADQFGSPEDKSHSPRPHPGDQESRSGALSEPNKVPRIPVLSELRSLNHEAARQVHPDTATSEQDRARREQAMQEVNAAYAAGDEDALRRIVIDLETTEISRSDIGHLKTKAELAAREGRDLLAEMILQNQNQLDGLRPRYPHGTTAQPAK